VRIDLQDDEVTGEKKNAAVVAKVVGGEATRGRTTIAESQSILPQQRSSDNVNLLALVGSRVLLHGVCLDLVEIVCEVIKAVNLFQNIIAPSGLDSRFRASFIMC
jgi:hypothetical protein